MTKELPENRIRLILFGTFVYGAILVIALFRIQIFQHEQYSIMADNQHWSKHNLASGRGKIISGDGYVLADNEVGYLLFADPYKITDAPQLADAILEVLGPDKIRPYLQDWKNYDDEVLQRESTDSHHIKNTAREYLISRLSLKLNWVAIVRHLNEDQKNKLEAKNLPGLGFERDDSRRYPEGPLGAHVLGFLGSDTFGEPKGYFGIEGYWDGDLRGNNGYFYEERSASGNPILVGEYKRVDPIAGREITLTIDRSLQKMLEDHLTKGVIDNDAKSGSAIIIEPGTGKILAMANFPNYDPNTPFPEIFESPDADKNDDPPAWRQNINRRNDSIATTYEPGSVIKPLTMSAALDLEKVNPQTTVIDNGPLKVGEDTIDNWDKKHHGVITMIDILALSDNVGSAQVGKMVGAANLYDYFSAFGLGKLTGIDLEGEDAGILREAAGWREIETMNHAFGQGFLATPLQVITAYSVFPNKGMLIRPYIVSQVNEGGTITNFEPEIVRRVINEETALTINDMLVKAVENGESRFYNLRNYTIAGKTGTAQIAEKGRYDSSLTNSTFVGYLPKDPKFLLLVKLEKPRASIYAAETAVPMFMDITRELVAYFGIPPDK